MRIHHLSCGTMRPVAFGGRHMICHCLLIETPKDGLVLVDGGLGTPDLIDPAKRLGKPFAKTVRPDRDLSHAAVSQVKALGFDPKDVRHIVLTHMDLDHTGGLVDFPDASVHVHAAEHAIALAPDDFAAKQRYVQAMWAHHPRFETYSDVGEPWFGFDTVRGLRGLPDDILFIPTAGHTRGHSCVAVKHADGWLVHAGDAYFDYAEVHGRVRKCPIPLRIFQTLVEVDRKSRLDNQDRLRDLVAKHGSDVRVFCAHDASELTPRA